MKDLILAAALLAPVTGCETPEDFRHVAQAAEPLSVADDGPLSWRATDGAEELKGSPVSQIPSELRCERTSSRKRETAQVDWNSVTLVEPRERTTFALHFDRDIDKPIRENTFLKFEPDPEMPPEFEWESSRVLVLRFGETQGTYEVRSTGALAESLVTPQLAVIEIKPLPPPRRPIRDDPGNRMELLGLLW